MNNTIIYYYSKTGNNKYIAKRIANYLKCNSEKIIPKPSFFFYLLMSTGLNFPIKIATLKNTPSDYEKIIICSPIWFGKMLSPIKTLIDNNLKSADSIYFITCCGCSDEKKDDKFGYEDFFKNLKKKLKERLKGYEAIPITLTLSEEIKNDNDAMMNARLSDDNYENEIKKRLESFIKKI